MGLGDLAKRLSQEIDYDLLYHPERFRRPLSRSPIEMTCCHCGKKWMADPDATSPYIALKVVQNDDWALRIRPLIVTCSEPCYKAKYEEHERENHHCLWLVRKEKHPGPMEPAPDLICYFSV